MKNKLPLALFAVVCFLLGFLTRTLSERSPLQHPKTPKEDLNPFAALQGIPSLPTSPATAPTPLLPTQDEINEVKSLFQSFFEDQLQVPPIQGIGTEKMERREDEEAIYYDLPMENLKKSSLKITIQDGQINVSGEVQQPGLLSEFTKSLPVPRGVDAEKVDIRQEPDKIVIRFPRKK